MGVDAYLVRHDNKTMFDIGRASGAGSLIVAFGGDEWLGNPVYGIKLPSAARLTKRLINAIERGGWEMSENDTAGYARDLAARILRFADGQPIDWLSTYETCNLKGRYTQTDTRYSDAWDYYDVFRLLPQKTRCAIQRGRGPLKRFDYVRMIGLDDKESERFLAELRYAGKSPLQVLASVAPRAKRKKTK